MAPASSSQLSLLTCVVALWLVRTRELRYVVQDLVYYYAVLVVDARRQPTTVLLSHELGIRLGF